MMTYLLLNIIILLLVGIVFGVRVRKPSKRGIVLAMVLLALTFVFDSLIIMFHIVVYAPDHLLGVALGVTPIEDYFYTLVAVALVPLLWNKEKKRG